MKSINLNKISDEELLNLKICDLPLSLKGTPLTECIGQLYRELENKGIQFKPACYLADEWLTPDGEPVIGIPFFLAHPRLMRLENKMMLEVEGGTKSWCMKLLRHEAGHAINYAYRLYRRKKWKDIFGEFNKEYTDTYRFRRYSKSFVRHLEDYYAQYHPDEDFAETFAVWLTPGYDWRAYYKKWGALKKLEYVDALMKEIKSKPPFISKGKLYWQASRLRSTLKNYYRKKRHFYAEYFPEFHDANLKKIFITADKTAGLSFAHRLISKNRKYIVKTVCERTGEKKYIVDDLIGNIIERCRQLHLYVPDDEHSAVLKISVYVAVLVMNYMYTGRFRGKSEKKT